MKTILLVITAVCFMMACSKSDQVSPQLSGKWELRRTYGGFLGRDSSYSAGNGNIYQFDAGNIYKHFTMGKLDTQGTYHIRKNYGTTPNAVPFDEILFDNNTGGEPISIKGTKISIGTTIADGIIYEYQKL